VLFLRPNYRAHGCTWLNILQAFHRPWSLWLTMAPPCLREGPLAIKFDTHRWRSTGCGVADGTTICEELQRRISDACAIVPEHDDIGPDYVRDWNRRIFRLTSGSREENAVHRIRKINISDDHRWLAKLQTRCFGLLRLLRRATL
jgi:hypothetical protein